MDHPVARSENIPSFLIVVAKGQLATLVDLRSAGFQAEVVGYHEFSGETVRRQRPAIVFLDRSLPIKVAVEICSSIKGDADCHGTLVFMLLNRPGDYRHLTISTFRPDQHLVEPFTLTDLRTRINLLLNSRHRFNEQGGKK